MAYIVDLETFHGPLDLLLYLIEKNEIDIYDIPIAEITNQYIDYLRDDGQIHLDKLGEFLVLASYLLNLKSSLLLPKNIEEQDNIEEDQIDPRQELVNRLLDYKRFKKCAEYLEQKQHGNLQRVFFKNNVLEKNEKEVLLADVKLLVKAFHKLSLKDNTTEEKYEMPQNNVSIDEKIEDILSELHLRGKKGFIFQGLFSAVKNKREAVVLFLALLELIRLKKVEAFQASRFGEITVYLRVI
ncbi:Segregation and condensation protein A [Candidatus Syntrophocurvum alkaliphilum]|uniref:Segregation and condensation protein A n=1 Tax=Candidatus Syntrophocurvum alkaliphilum TaxID=2293317 RepID=A0A6I6DKW9_9FIRM|nr:segregation/condensation protein A [Candidatus Syntrophocurvum alkaliphilum]QGT99901.1 Segregation and condensation protein A [Candidatus Syntrophocurvum alkaliphilum]